MDRFKEITSFVGAADKGSFAAAAMEEGVTPVVIGRRIDALEKRLGARLLHRSTRRLTLTEDGAVFLDHCRRVLADVETAERAVSAGRHAAIGHLVVSAPAGFGRRHVASHGSAFIRAHPKVQLSFNLSDRVVDLVREGTTSASDRRRARSELCRHQARGQPPRRVRTPAYFKRHGSRSARRSRAPLSRVQLRGQQHGWLFERGGRQVNVRVSGNLD
jgi:DNA-binding transcriptional LysR family regulator